MQKTTEIKTYWLQSPNGEEHTIKFIKRFCAEHGLDMSSMLKVAKGKITNHRGWICRLVDDDGTILKPVSQPKTKIKSFLITDSNGVIYANVKNLKQFCIDHNISYSSMKDISNGIRVSSYRGWNIRAETPDYSGVATSATAERARLDQEKKERIVAEQEAKKFTISNPMTLAEERRACIEFPNNLTVDNEFAYIYRMTNLVNGKKYIGVSNDPHRRLVEHCKPSNDELIARALKKHGRHAFDKEIILKAPVELCFEMEDFWIEKNNSRNHVGHGYNNSIGGRGTKAGTVFGPEARSNMKAGAQGRKSRGPQSEETKAKIAAKQKGVSRKPWSEEEKLKRSIANKGKPKSEEHKLKIGAKTAERMKNPDMREKVSKTHKGKIVSEETKEKQRIAHLGKQFSDETKQKLSDAKIGRPSNRWKNYKKPGV